MNPIKLIITRFKAVALICFMTMIVLTSCGPVSSVAPTPPAVAGDPNVALVSLNTVDPFANSSTEAPSGYTGPLFQLSHNYPASKPAGAPAWLTKLRSDTLKGQPISTQTGIAYTNGLKAYITPSMRKLIFHYKDWDAAKEGWYNEPWLADIRDPIHGMYVGSSLFPANTFTGQSADLATYVLTYYDNVAAYTLGQVWANPKKPKTDDVNAAQFPEGAVVIKLAFVNISGKQWPAMQGAADWPAYQNPNPNDPNFVASQNPALFNLYLMQCDIIVKDTVAAPKTGWVFTTLVFDNSVTGDAWDQMIPLGAMWGNDPDQDFENNPAGLNETVINPDLTNPNSPIYTAYPTETLGWGGRLSGPNDGALAAPAYVNGVIANNVAASSCMSCHSVAEWPMKSFLLPSPGGLNPPAIDNALVLFQPGSKPWLQWFQDRSGTEPKDAGATAFDYDMVFVFKSLPAWYKATYSDKPKGAGDYNGAP